MARPRRFLTLCVPPRISHIRGTISGRCLLGLINVVSPPLRLGYANYVYAPDISGAAWLPSDFNLDLTVILYPLAVRALRI